MRRHRDQCPIRQEEVRLISEPLDAGKNVIPAPAVEPGGMLAQLVKNLLHLERCRNRLDQNGGANRSLRNAKFILRELEGIIPNPRFQVALHLREVKIRTGAASEQLLRVVEKVETEIEETAGDRRAIDQHVFL